MNPKYVRRSWFEFQENHRRVSGQMPKGYFLTIIGLICFFEGLPYFASPEKLKQFMARMIRVPDRALRVLGGAMMVLGLLLVYWGRHYAH